MQIAVTGAAGRVGEFVVAELLRDGHGVVAVDLREPTPSEAVYRRADVERTDSLVEALAGCEAIIHLAAVAEEGILSRDATFRVNAQGTVNCLEAAERAGLQRFVLASSEGVLGFSYREREMKPDYFPIDEAHPLRPQDSYGLSKIAAEEACRTWTRRGALSTVCIRPCYCWGITLGEEAVMSLQDPAAHYRSLWVYIHLRDVARAYRLACEKEDLEHETFYVVADDVRSGVPTAELVERYYPGVPLKRPLGDYGSLIANDRAREVLGFEPELSWRDEVSPEQVPSTLEAA
ncbi:MAG TPA: NAD(P)-dependent oxidoreductase [Thermoleophilaceae bacterium]|nr:NAD(P)-dependent oxidoreductase [Thermoleophilaceae bacterium]